MVKEDKQTWKAKYFVKAARMLNDYEKCFIVGVDNVRSKQMQQIRSSLRGEAEVLMGKNTMIKKVIRGELERKPHLEKLMPHLIENVGFVFTREDVAEIKDKILANRVRAPAKAGAIAPVSVTVPAQNTGLGPEKTSFFQALQIPTKITKGTIEIINDVLLLKEGDKVGPSEAALLQMLKIHPFSYGLVVRKVFDNGTIFDPKVLDITTEDMKASILSVIREIAAIGMATGYVNAASAPHMLANAFKNCVAIAVETDYSFKEAEKFKEFVADPSKFAAATAAPVAAAAAAAPAAAAKKDESEESDDDFGAGGLFD